MSIVLIQAIIVLRGAPLIFPKVNHSAAQPPYSRMECYTRLVILENPFSNMILKKELGSKKISRSNQQNLTLINKVKCLSLLGIISDMLFNED